MELKHITKSEFEQETATGVTLIDFYATWCGPCQAIAPILENIADENKDFKIVKVDVDQEPELAGDFSVMSIPTMIVFKDGKKIDQKIGGMSKEDILTWVKSV